MNYIKAEHTYYYLSLTLIKLIFGYMATRTQRMVLDPEENIKVKDLKNKSLNYPPFDRKKKTCLAIVYIFITTDK